MSKSIPVGKSHSAVVDDADYELVSKYSWYLQNNAGRPYAVRRIRIIKEHWDWQFMHQMILRPVDMQPVDHVNGDGLDNRRSNLRLCSTRENNRNRGGWSKSSSYKGVKFHAQKFLSKPWEARIRLDGKLLYLGMYPTAEIAAKVYNDKAVELFGEFAQLNTL